jgi:hypothetical protein
VHPAKPNATREESGKEAEAREPAIA